MSFSPFALLVVFVCFVMLSCSRESVEETPDDEKKSPVPLSSGSNLTHGSEGVNQGSESNYSVDLSAPGAISIDQATFSEAIDLNENGQCFDKQTGDLLEGQFRIISQNGSLLSSSFFRGGLYHGKREDYHENGVTSVSSSYFYGKKNGKEEWRAESGIKTYEANFRQDLIEGLETTWDEDGQVVSKYRFEGGKLVERLIENGTAVSQ
ncbi:MAG: hypothetical protein HN531_04965 [Opitutae bacterium]|jgi:antitoxin component YwqK of YwqJK toxin-antitoxin module|nr:hypothetical protein [Opitutae bacterium]